LAAGTHVPHQRSGARFRLQSTQRRGRFSTLSPVRDADSAGPKTPVGISSRVNQNVKRWSHSYHLRWDCGDRSPDSGLPMRRQLVAKSRVGGSISRYWARSGVSYRCQACRDPACRLRCLCYGTVGVAGNSKSIENCMNV